MAPAVHLWWSTTDPNAPSGDSFDWIYMEALIPEVYKQSCTYQMPIGPRAPSFWVLIPISAPNPNCAPSVKLVGALT